MDQHPTHAPEAQIPRQGRRAGGGAKEAIESAAREQFAEHGFTGVSVRSVAKAAGVDPALIRHYFGDKQGLFDAVATLPIDPRAVIEYVTSGGIDAVGARLADVVADMVLDQERSVVVTALVRAATEPSGDRFIRETVTKRLIEPLARSLAVDSAEQRSALVASQVIGFLVAGRIVALRPLAQMTRGGIVSALGPTFQRYLTGQIEGSPAQP